MTGNEAARAFLESISGYADNPEGSVPSQDKPVKLGTVDPAFDGTGRPMVLFDGETLMGVKTYPWAGLPPRAGDRVVLLPQGRSYVIVGSLDTVPGSDIPVGTAIEGHWTTAPLGFLLEDGALKLIADYPELYAVIGTRYNTGGETGAQFRLPDSRGRAAVGKAAAGAFGTLGAKVGTETHQHGLTGAQAAWFSGVYQNRALVNWTATNTHSASVIGGSAAVNVNGIALVGQADAGSSIQPSMVYNRAVKY